MKHKKSPQLLWGGCLVGGCEGGYIIITYNKKQFNVPHGRITRFTTNRECSTVISSGADAGETGRSSK